MFKLHISPNICFEHQISSGNLSHDGAFDRRTLLFKWNRFILEIGLFLHVARTRDQIIVGIFYFCLEKLPLD